MTHQDALKLGDAGDQLLALGLCGLDVVVVRLDEVFVLADDALDLTSAIVDDVHGIVAVD